MQVQWICGGYGCDIHFALCMLNPFCTLNVGDCMLEVSLQHFSDQEYVYRSRTHVDPLFLFLFRKLDLGTRKQGQMMGCVSNTSGSESRKFTKTVSRHTSGGLSRGVPCVDPSFVPK